MSSRSNIGVRFKMCALVYNIFFYCDLTLAMLPVLLRVCIPVLRHVCHSIMQISETQHHIEIRLSDILQGPVFPSAVI